ncbi:MAG: uridine kinase, partial [Desulfoferrobacter sp.]
MTAYVVGIAGPSCSGKSLIAKQLAFIYSRHSPCVLALDSYYHDLSGLQPLERAGQNYDTPEAIDVELLETQLTTLLAGGEIEKPVYDYETHTRSAVTE